MDIQEIEEVINNQTPKNTSYEKKLRSDLSGWPND